MATLKSAETKFAKELRSARGRDKEHDRRRHPGSPRTAMPMLRSICVVDSSAVL